MTNILSKEFVPYAIVFRTDQTASIFQVSLFDRLTRELTGYIHARDNSLFAECLELALSDARNPKVKLVYVTSNSDIYSGDYPTNVGPRITAEQYWQQTTADVVATADKQCLAKLRVIPPHGSPVLDEQQNGEMFTSFVNVLTNAGLQPSQFVWWHLGKEFMVQITPDDEEPTIWALLPPEWKIAHSRLLSVARQTSSYPGPPQLIGDSPVPQRHCQS